MIKTIFKYLMIVVLNFVVISLLKNINHYDLICYLGGYIVSGIANIIIYKDW